MSARTVLRRCLLASILPAVVILPAVGYRWHVDRKGRQLRDAAVARIEATDPRWRWEDIEADRPTPRDDQNAANFVAEFNHLIRPYEHSRRTARTTAVPCSIRLFPRTDSWTKKATV